MAAAWHQRGAAIHGLVRSPPSAEQLDKLGGNAIEADLDAPDTLPTLPAEGALVYYCAPPPGGEGEEDPRLGAVLERMTGQHPARFIYISTSGVYGDCRGAWVTEETPANPQTGRSRRRWSAEQALSAWAAAHDVDYLILRVPAIYGPHRLPLKRIEHGEPVVRMRESPWTNRIHIDDLARVCVAMADKGERRGVYNVSDGHPTKMTAYFNRVADFFGLPRPPAISLTEAQAQMSDTMYAFWCESRRVDNSKMRRTLDMPLVYPNLEAGLAACAQAGRDEA